MGTFKFPDLHVEKSSAEVHYTLNLDMDRFEGQFDKAQHMLDTQIMTDMIPYMPKVTGTFINRTLAMSASVAGSGYVYAAAPPYGRFLYAGKTMVSPSTGSTWAKYGEQKVLVSQYRGKTNAQENLTYNSSFNPRVTAEWYEEAKRRNGKRWINMTKGVAGDGRR